MIRRKEAHYDFIKTTPCSSCHADLLAKNFYIAFPLPTADYLQSLTGDTVLLEIPGSLTLRLIRRSYLDTDPQIDLMRREGCFHFKEENEWILEAVCSMCTKDHVFSDVYTVRLPLSAPFAQNGDVAFYFDGVWLRFMKNGKILNENSGLDCFVAPCAAPHIAADWQNAFRFAHVDEVAICYTDHEEVGNADFYSPADWNVYAGDVMNYYHNGVYHVLFLRDRRHHLSRNGNGAHDIYHLTSRDLRHWTEQEPLAVIDQPWLTYGTGTMLFHNGTYYMTYGFHTERYQGNAEKVSPEPDPVTHSCPILSCSKLLRDGKLPGGASYATSQDGIHFVPSDHLFHPGTNPSTYAMPDGKLKLYVGYRGDGIWESDDMAKPFHITQEDFSFVASSVMKNTTECPSFFEWNGYRYLIIGFTGYYRTLTTTDDTYVDMAGKEDIYDGLCVPMVTSYANDRRLITGWLNGVGWGSVIVHRELLQEKGGRLGMKWVPEMIPDTTDLNLWSQSDATCATMDNATGKGYLLEMTVDPKHAKRLGIQFAKGENASELQLDFTKKRMQMMETATGTLAESFPTTFEIATEAGDAMDWLKAEQEGWCVARNTKNFCIADIPGMQQPFTVKVLLRYSQKLRSTVIDAEIAGRRTIISVRDGFFPDTVSVISEGEISMCDCSLKPLQSPIA